MTAQFKDTTVLLVALNIAVILQTATPNKSLVSGCNQLVFLFFLIIILQRPQTIGVNSSFVVLNSGICNVTFCPCTDSGEFPESSVSPEEGGRKPE